jgi:hypothetical protein
LRLGLWIPSGMSKRAGPPLFELLRERGESPIHIEPGSRPGTPGPTAQTPARPASAAAPAEAPTGTPKPKPEQAPSRARELDSGIPWSTGGVTRAERSAATFEDEPAQSGEIKLSATKFYLGIAVALVLIVGAWAAGYKLGQREATQQLAASVRYESVVVPPRAVGSSTEQAPDRTVEANPQRPTAEPTRQAPAQQPAARPSPLPANWALLADGLRAADPRVPGTNYLELATLPADQAADALNFLAGRGVRAIGVPVDSGARAGNNPSRYTLYSLGLAVPSGQYSSTTSERRDHERLVASIGADWMRDRRGGSNFSQTLWRRYDP